MTHENDEQLGPDPTWITPRDAARLLTVCERTIRRRLPTLPEHLVSRARYGEVPGVGKRGGAVVHQDALAMLRSDPDGPSTPTTTSDGHRTADNEQRTPRERLPRRPKKRRRDRPRDYPTPVEVAQIPHDGGVLAISLLTGPARPLVTLADLERCHDGKQRPAASAYRRVVLRAEVFEAVADALTTAGGDADLQSVPVQVDGDRVALASGARNGVGVLLLADRTGDVSAVSIAETTRSGRPRRARTEWSGAFVVMAQATARRLASVLRSLAEGWIPKNDADGAQEVAGR